MALDKKITLDSGADANHWVIKDITIHYWIPRTIVHLEGYISKATKDEKKKPLTTKELIINGIVGLTGDSRADTYTILKSLPEFAGAKDA